MRPVWNQAVNALKTANRICVIGYSMPETDTFFKFLLALGLAENHRLYRFVLVDLLAKKTLAGDFSSEPQLPNNIEARYKAMFETTFVKRRFKFFPDGFAGFLSNIGPAMGRAEIVVNNGIY
jgi:hypothetical protein